MSHQPHHRRTQVLRERLEPLIDVADQGLYVIVAALFLVAAAVLAVHAVAVFLQGLDHNVPGDVITFVNALLLVLIILEVLGTVRDFLASGTTSLKPFLYIGIISATRRILAIGAVSALGSDAGQGAEPFNHLMIDLGVNGAVVLALALAVFLFSRGEAHLADAADSSSDSPSPAEE